MSMDDVHEYELSIILQCQRSGMGENRAIDVRTVDGYQDFFIDLHSIILR